MRQRRLRGIEVLEGRCMLAADPIISEFSASNDNAIDDGFGNSSDWIEIYNRGDTGIDLVGYRLTDNLGNLGKWQFPSVYLDAGAFLLVFASGADTIDPAGYLHTNFSLAAAGESVALVSPQGGILSQYDYPALEEDESFGLAFDSQSQQVLGPFSPARYLVPTNGAVDGVWMSPGFNDSGWLVGTASIGYGNSPGLYAGLYHTALTPGVTSVYVRIPFTVESADALLADLSLKYDDGFVAYLNGVEVARDNAPQSANYGSVAIELRVREAAVQSRSFDVLAHSHLLVEGENVLAVHLLNKGADTDLLFSPQLTIASGTPAVVADVGPLAFATPGLPNSVVQSGEIIFSRSGGTFAAPFQLVLTSTQSGDVIRYTTNGTVPGPNSPLYEGPLNVTASTQLRARTFGPQGRVGNVSSQAYTLTQSIYEDFTSDLPIIVLENYGKGIPGRAWQDSYFSLYDVDPVTGRSSVLGEADITTRAAQHRRGASSYGNPKYSLRIELRDEHGNDRDFEMLGLSPDSDWVLFAPYGTDRTMLRNSLWFDLSNQMGDYALKTRYVEVFSNMDGGPLDANDYMGVYVLMENVKVDEHRLDIEKLRPTDNTHPEITGGYVFKIDRETSEEDAHWNSERGSPHNTPVFVHVEPERWEMTQEQVDYIRKHIDDVEDVLYGPFWLHPTLGYEAYIDVESYVDHYLLRTFSKEKDSLTLSEYIYKDRNGKFAMGPVWDFDLSSGYADDPVARGPEGWSWRRPEMWNYGWFGRLFTDPNFSQRFVDRWQELRAGVFSDESLIATIQAHAAQVEESQVRNYLRWPETLNQGGYWSDPSLTGWEAAISSLQNWTLLRAAWIDSQMIAPTEAEYTVDGLPGFVEVTLAATHEGGAIYYTIDGTDPRNVGGSIAPGSQLYTGPLSLPMGTKLTARVYDATHQWRWSGPTTLLAAVEKPADSTNLRLTELHYHPANPTAAELAAMPGVVDNEFEFLELTNVSADWVSLAGATFTSGIEFSFAGADITVLAPGTSVVLVSNRQAFELRYGTGLPVAGEYEGQLGNSDDQITIVGALGEEIFHISYLDTSPWPAAPDGNGPTLEILDPRFEANDPRHWRASRILHGTPGVATRWGDFDGSGTVDTDDYQLWKSSYGQTVTPFTGADANGDRVVDAADFLVWRNQLGESLPAAVSMAIDLTSGETTEPAALSVQPGTSPTLHQPRPLAPPRRAALADVARVGDEHVLADEHHLPAAMPAAINEGETRGEWRPQRRRSTDSFDPQALEAAFALELDWGIHSGQ